MKPIERRSGPLSFAPALKSILKRKPPASEEVNIDPVRPDRGRHGIAIAACVKNEAEYITDWLLFHRAVGVRHFFIYDNASVDATGDVIRSVAKAGEVTILPWSFDMVDVDTQETLDAQIMAFAHAIVNYGSHHRWMAFIDADEFLLPKKGVTIEEALAGVSGFPNVSLPRHSFGSERHETKQDGSVLRNCTSRVAAPISKAINISDFKCVVDPCAISDVSVHYYRTRQHGDVSSNDAGMKATLEGRNRQSFYSSQYLQLNRYARNAIQDIGPAAVEDRSMPVFLDENRIELSR